MLGDCTGVYDLHTELNAVAKDFIASAPYCHVVMVVTSFLHGKIAERIAHLLSDLQPLECHVFCSVSEGMHAEAFPVVGKGAEEDPLNGYSHYGEFQALMRKWISRESGVRASVHHADLFHAEIFPGLLVLPPFHKIFPLIPSDITYLQTKLVEEGDLDTSLSNLGSIHYSILPRQLQLAYKCVAVALNEFLGTLDIREDIFSLGHTSRLIANQLAALPEARARRKSAAQRASLVVLDCTLDLAASCFHATDWVGEKVLSSLPMLAPDSNDISISMAPVSAVTDGGVLPGCLAQPHSSQAQNLLRTIVCSKQKEALMEISRCLLEALSQEGLPVKHGGRIGKPSADLLKLFLEQFKSQPNAIVSQREVLQLACAVLQSLELTQGQHWDEIAAVEKSLLMPRNGSSVAQLLTTLMQQQLTGGGSTLLTLSELLGLGILMFSMLGNHCYEEPKEEEEMKVALVMLIQAQRQCDGDFIKALHLHSNMSKVNLEQKAEEIIDCLTTLTDTRADLKQFSETHTKGVPPYQPLLSQVMEAIVSPARPDLPDLTYHSYGLADILKSGFSLFMSSARPRPSNHPLLLLFVVGGVSCADVRHIRDIVTANKNDMQVVILTTQLLTPATVVHKVMCLDHLNP